MCADRKQQHGKKDILLNLTECLPADKLRGGYYTPQAVAKWLARWAIRSGEERVLEPSCGDGAFLEATLAEIGQHKARPGHDPSQIVGIELIREEA